MNTPINEAVEREAFEKWANSINDQRKCHRLKGTDQYTIPDVQAAWKAWKARAALPPPIVEPVRYEARMRAPNGNLAGWHASDKQAFEKHRYNSDIGDGFSYEVRALYDHAPASAPSDGAADARDATLEDACSALHTGLPYPTEACAIVRALKSATASAHNTTTGGNENV